MVIQNAPVQTVTRMVPVGEASQILSVHPNPLRKWSDSGMIPSYRIGQRRDRRFSVADLVAFLERGGGLGPDLVTDGRMNGSA